MSHFENRQQYNETDISVCRDYLRNVCKRGKKCKFKHPAEDECEKLRRLEKTFCHDYQNSTCRRPACKFLHYTREEEEIFRRTGYLPNEIQYYVPVNFKAVDERAPVCKDFINGACSRGANCKYRHVNANKETTNYSLCNQTNIWDETVQSNVHLSTKMDTSIPAFSQISNSYHISTSEAFPISNSSMLPSYHATLLTLPTSTLSSHLSQRSVLTNSIHESILKPVNEVYVAEDNQNSILGVIDNSSTRQPTLYAHPLVSGTNNASCSSMLKVTPDQHTNMVHHPSAIPPTHTTYHLVPHDPNPHHHILGTSSTHSQAPTLFTIPLSQFGCDVSHASNLVHPQGTIACTNQRPIFTGVVATNTSLTNSPAAFYPSYNLLHINQSARADDSRELDIQNTVQNIERKNSVTTTASSTNAVLAAAAAAGYLAQHLPAIASNSLSINNISNDINEKMQIQSESVDVHESAIVAAANLPTVSAAAAAAVVAAAAFAHSTSINRNNKCYTKLRNKLKGSDCCRNRPTITAQITTNQASRLNYESDSLFHKSSLLSSGSHTFNGESCETCDHVPLVTTTMATCTHTDTFTKTVICDNQTNTTSSIAKLLPNTSQCSTNSEYLHSHEDDHAKTAAAVAAACIGAIFSQPMAAAATGNPHSSSVAAMLGNLMGHNQQDLIQVVNPSSVRRVCTNKKSTPILVESKNVKAQCLVKEIDEEYLAINSKTLNDLMEREHLNSSKTILTDNLSTKPDCILHADTSLPIDNLIENSKAFPFCSTYSNPEGWSNVVTTMASAAKAAAAAAVAATAAVTGSANFFRLTQFKNKVEPLMVQNFQKLISTPKMSESSTIVCPSNLVQHKHFPMETENVYHSSLSDEPDLTSLSTKAAVTMTSAAAAAAMVAAAATVAAEQHHRIENHYLQKLDNTKKNGKRINSISSNLHKSNNLNVNNNTVCTRTTLNTLSPDTSDFYIACKSSDHYEPKRIKGDSLCKCSGFDHCLRHHRVSLTDTVDDFDDDETDIFEEDESESATILSPETTPPYILRTKHYSQVDNSRPINFNYNSSEMLKGSLNSWKALRNTKPSVNLNELKTRDITHSVEKKMYPLSKSSTSSNDNEHSNKNIGRFVFDENYPLRKTHSTGSLIIRSVSGKSVYESSILRHWKSYPDLYSQNLGKFKPNLLIDLSYVSVPRESNSNLILNKQSVRNSSKSHIYSRSTINSRKNTRKRKPLRNRNLAQIRQKMCRYLNSHLYSHSSNFHLSNSDSKDERPVSSAISPNSVLSEEYSIRDDIDDSDFIDPDDDDDEDLFDEMNLPHRSIKRTIHNLSNYSKRKNPSCNSTYQLNSGFTSMSSSSIQQHHSLRAENAHLRRKLFDVIRQRGDLRAANEILLEQNARLRQSSKRVSVVARMAESATKIIEAHSKSHFVQSSSFPASGPIASQAHVPFSIAQAAAAVVAAAAQNPSNAPALSGVYVSSPTASITQQTHPQAIGTLDASHMHPMFPQMVSANPMSNGIVIPSQIQTQHSSLSTSIHSQPTTATLLQHHPQTLDHRQPVISNYFPHAINPALESLTVSRGLQSLSPSSSTIQVCHYPVASIGNVYSKMPHDASDSPKLVSVGGPNTVTFLLGQTAPPTQTAYASHPTLPLQIPVTLETNLNSSTAALSSDSPLTYSRQGAEMWIIRP